MKPEPILILLVEDDPAHVTAIQRAFEASGSEFKIQAVGTLQEFRRSIAGQRPAIAVMDLKLLDGSAGKVLTQPPEAGPFPVLVMTGNGNEQGAVTAIKAGALDYVVKSPEAFADMPHTVTRVLHEWNLLREHRQAELALHEQEEWFRTVFENASDGVFFVSPGGEIVLVNESFAAMHGYSVAEILEMNLTDLATPESSRLFPERMRRVIAGEHLTFEVDHHHKHGHVFPLEVTANLVAVGGKKYVLASHRDITERKRAEEALRDSEEMLKRSQQVARVGHYKLDAVSGDWASSETLDDIFGIDAAFKRTVASWLNLVHPGDRDVMLDHFQNHVLKGRHPFDKEYRIVRVNDGSTRWVCGKGELRFNAAGDVLEMFGIIQDITERKRVEEELRLISAALEVADNAIVITDRAGAIRWANLAFTTLTGYTLAEALGKNPRFLKSGKHEPAFYHSLWDTILAGQVWRGEMTNRRKNGSVYTEEMTITPVRDERGEIGHFIAIKQDITERKQLQAQLLRTQRLESVGRLASGIAHDLNNLLSPMLLAPQLLRETVQDPDLRSLLDLIETNARRGSDIIKRLLTFGRGVESERVPVQLPALVLDMAGIIRETFPKNITTRRAMPAETWLVKGDATQLHQILMNLCVNARDAMPEGGTLTLKLENQEIDESFARMAPGARPGRYVCLSVTDTGQGIAPEHLDKIYDPFFTTKELGQGTGLGLSTVLGIVQSHGGFIQVQSQLGHGTQFMVYLPASETAEASPATQANLSVPQGHGELVLIVDDEESVRQVTRRFLERNGYRMIEAENGTTGIVQYAAHQQEVQMVVTDLIMPVMDGPAFIRVLRRMNPQVRVIVMSGQQDKPGLPADLALPDEAHLAKPFSGAMLLQTLHRVLHPEAAPKK